MNTLLWINGCVGIIALIIVILDIIMKKRNNLLPYLSAVLLFILFLITPLIIPFYSDPVGFVFAELFLFGTALVILASVKYSEQFHYRSEFFAIVLFAVMGMSMLATSTDLITFYISLEIVTVSFFLLASYRKDRKSGEAGLKMYIQGFTASAFLLYGLSIIYGLTSSTNIAEIAVRLSGSTNYPLLVMASAFVIAGLGFKISLVPFHAWAPDVYEGAPTPVTLLLSIGSKAAGFAAILRLFVFALAGSADWAIVLSVLAVFTMFFGNLVAIPQHNIKRMLAYSSIAHVGYMMIGIIIGSGNGIASLLFYLIVYTLANITAFVSVIIFSNQTNSDEISDYSGLHRRNPFLALSLAVALLSLGGLPPLAGFVGKFFLFSTAVSSGYMVLAAFGVINSIISMYYYLNVIRHIYWLEPKSADKILVDRASLIALAVALAGVVIMGILPDRILTLVVTAARAFI